MDRKIIIGLGIAFAVLITGLYVSFKPQPPATEVQTTSSDNVITYKCEDNKTAFDVLKQENKIESTESEFGSLVTSINGISQGGNKYWLYSVDNKEATISASEYNCQGGEIIKWELK